MALALFDLDNTLLDGDSDHLWGEHLAETGVVDAGHQRRENDRYRRLYEAGRLDIHEFLEFALAPLAHFAPAQLLDWRRAFVQSKIEPRMLPAARRLVATHRERGDRLAIVTATNRFVTEPIAELFGIDTLLATEAEMRGGRFTGKPSGTPTFREGKVAALRHWLSNNDIEAADAWFYSDSINDLPLLEHVDHAVAVDPDRRLDAQARQRGWPRITLRRGAQPEPLDDA